MKIKGISAGTPNMAARQKKAEIVQKSGEGKLVGRDTLVITGNRKEQSEADFVSSLKSTLMKEVQRGTPEYQIRDIKMQIASGDYDVNVSEIVRKMTLDSDI